MQLIKKTGEYTIYRKANNRYAVQDANRQWVNGEAKVTVLKAEGLIKAPEPRPAPPAEEADASAEAAPAEGEGQVDAPS